MIPRTQRTGCRPLLATNGTASSWTAGVSSTTKPVAANGVGVIDFTSGIEFFSRDSGMPEAPDNLRLKFFGARTAADDETFTARIERWDQASDGQWHPTGLIECTVTQGTSTGNANFLPANTDYLADTLVVTKAATSAYEVVEGNDNTPAELKVDIYGADLIVVRLATGTNASCNVLWGVF